MISGASPAQEDRPKIGNILGIFILLGKKYQHYSEPVTLEASRISDFFYVLILIFFRLGQAQ